MNIGEFEKYWTDNASKESCANKSVAWRIWESKQAEIDQLKSDCTLHKDRVRIAKDLIEAKDKRIAELESKLYDLHASSVMAEVNRKTEVEYFELEEFLLSEMAEGMLNEPK